jgi:hypothetical protein
MSVVFFFFFELFSGMCFLFSEMMRYEDVEESVIEPYPHRPWAVLRVMTTENLTLHFPPTPTMLLA